MSQPAGSRAGDASAESLYRPYPCTLESIEDLTPTEKLFRIVRCDGKPFGHKPGQFVQVSIPGAGEAPISVSSSPTRGDYLELGIRKAGTLTGIMHDQLKPGDTIGIRGPFGTHFDTDAMHGKDLILISGGCGLAPMRALIQYCEDRRDEFRNVTVLYGAKSPQDVLYKGELLTWQASEALHCRYTVDNVTEGTCWDGNVGLITTLIPPLDVSPKDTVAVVVGPPVMYKYVIAELRLKGLTDDDIIVSLERHMKCGVGKCGHCTIDHLYVCLDGPVFRLSQVKTVRDAL
ncbi:MAG TPA: FAD/NAD(P)-binding protein [Planctomycetota bacterium]|nr:FAD/NAD(P)-binding protein [Planctomycetota bacterium]